MSQPFLSEIKIMSFGFAPKGWAMCNGQLLPINQNQGLFSLLGTTYGGNGQTTFGLPDLRGRVPMHMGDAGFGGHTLGERGGEYAHTVNISELAAHSHSPVGKAVTAGATPPATNTALAQGRAAATGTPDVNIYGTGAPSLSFNPGVIGAVGGSQPHQNQQPFLTLNICIALQGIFPSQT
jgi:microcystin-dependent protein